MHRRVVALVPVLVFTLACGGLGASETVVVEKVVEVPAEAPSEPTLEGRWCENDPEVGCYRFEGDVVHEEAVKTRSVRKPATEGTWKQEGKMLILTFPEGPWTLEVKAHTESVLVVTDHSQNDTFTFTRTE